jgi:hypothetical protein
MHELWERRTSGGRIAFADEAVEQPLGGFDKPAREKGEEMKSLCVSALVVLSVALVGCASSGGGNSSYQTIADAHHENYKAMSLSYGTVYKKDVYTGEAARLGLDPFLSTIGAASVLEHFGALSRVEPRQLYELVKATSEGIPALNKPLEKPALIRNVAVGAILNDQDPLVLEVLLADPSVLKESQAEYVLILLSNAMKFSVTEKATGETRLSTTDYPENTMVNWYWAAQVKGGQIMMRHFAGGLKVNAAGTAEDRVNLTDDMLKDDDPTNDAAIPSILNPIIADTAANATTRAAARMNLFLYALSTGQYDAGLEGLREVKKAMDSDAKVGEAVGNAYKAAQIIYRVTRALAERDESYLSTSMDL